MEEVLKIDSISKHFPGVQALNKVSFGLEKGKIYGLVGENGAGKSTLVKILMGLYQPDSGEIIVKGKKVTISDPTFAREKCGIDTVFQEHSLIPQMSIAENIFLDKLEKYYTNGVINYRKLREDAKRALKAVNLDMDVSLPAGEISEGEKSLIEFARSLNRDPDILIFDEMTASLESNIVREVFDIMRDLKKKNKTLIFISHRLKEVLRVCDEILVLKDGNFQGIVDNQRKDTNPEIIREKIINKMTGRKTGLLFPPKNKLKRSTEVVLSISNLSNQYLKKINLEIYKGEIVALAGLRGQGQSKLLRTIAGLLPKNEGTIKLFGKELIINNPRSAIKNGVFYISNQRDLEGLWLSQDVWLNISLPSINKRSKFGIISKRNDKKVVENMIHKLEIKTPFIRQLVRYLSGGNKQKVVLAKWLLAQPKILLIDQPTMGLDIGAKIEIYKILRQLSNKGISTLVVLAELEEVTNLPDRVLVMREGQIVNEFIGEIKDEELLDSYYV